MRRGPGPATPRTSTGSSTESVLHRSGIIPVNVQIEKMAVDYHEHCQWQRTVGPTHQTVLERGTAEHSGAAGMPDLQPAVTSDGDSGLVEL